MAKDLSNQIVGVCRFSYACEGGFASATMEQWALEAMLYDPARMKQRFVLFEKSASRPWPLKRIRISN